MVKFPRAFADDTADIGVLGPPGRQQLLALDEGHPPSKAHSPELSPEFLGKKTEPSVLRNVEPSALPV
jgi:hypothetical protein